MSCKGEAGRQQAGARLTIVRTVVDYGTAKVEWSAGTGETGIGSCDSDPRSPIPSPQGGYTPAGAAPAMGAVTTAFWIHLVVTDFGRVMARPSARAMTACEQTPSARDTANSTV